MKILEEFQKKRQGNSLKNIIFRIMMNALLRTILILQIFLVNCVKVFVFLKFRYLCNTKRQIEEKTNDINKYINSKKQDPKSQCCL